MLPFRPLESAITFRDAVALDAKWSQSCASLHEASSRSSVFEIRAHTIKTSDVLAWHDVGTLESRQSWLDEMISCCYPCLAVLDNGEPVGFIALCAIAPLSCQAYAP